MSCGQESRGASDASHSASPLLCVWVVDGFRFRKGLGHFACASVRRGSVGFVPHSQSGCAEVEPTVVRQMGRRGTCDSGRRGAVNVGTGRRAFINKRATSVKRERQGTPAAPVILFPTHFPNPSSSPQSPKPPHPSSTTPASPPVQPISSAGTQLTSVPLDFGEAFRYGHRAPQNCILNSKVHISEALENKTTNKFA